MKKLYFLLFALAPFLAQAQLKQIAFAELTAGSGMFFGAEMTTTTITVTVQGPSDRFIAFGFGTGMASGNDAIIWSTTGTGAAPLQLRDHRMAGTGVEPTIDAQQDWTVISNNVSGGNRTIVASRALNTGDANDVVFNFAATTQNLFWSKGPSATNQLQYHGASNRASGIVRNWVTVDQTPPTLSSTTPADNANGVSLTQSLSMTFNEPISFGTGSFYLYDSNDNLIQQVASGGPGLNIIGGNTVSWNPTANFVVNTSYYVQIDATTVKDAAGNFYVGISDETTFNFNTNDIVPPALAANPFIPADNSVGVPLNQNLSVTFNEPVFPGSGSINLYDISNTLIESFDISTSPLVTFVGNTIQIDPTNDLIINTQYYVHIPSGVVSDASGNLYTGFVTNTVWNWNTNDVIAPTAVTPFIPADGESAVILNPSCSISFSEDIQLNPTGSLNVYDAPGNLIESFTSSSPNINASGSTVSFTFINPLPEWTIFYVQVANNFISDLSGNNFAGILDQTTWDFETGDFTNPSISLLNPLDNESSVSIIVTPTIEFTEDVTIGNGSIYLVNEATQQIETFNAFNGNITENGTSLTLNPATALQELSNYHVLIDNDAVKDIYGNFFEGITDSTEWSFSTGFGPGINELSLSELISWNGKDLVIKVSFNTAEIRDINGKKITEIKSDKTSLDLLSKGVYILSIVAKNENPVVLRIYVD